jgi:hypothetical protein
MNNRFTKGNTVSGDGRVTYLLTDEKDVTVAFVFYAGGDAPSFKEVLDKVNALVEASETNSGATYFIRTKTDSVVAVDFIMGSSRHSDLVFDWDKAAIPGNFESPFSGNQSLVYVKRHFMSMMEDVPSESKDWQINAARNTLRENLQRKYLHVMPKHDEVVNTIKTLITARFPGSDFVDFGGLLSVRVPELFDLARMTVCLKRYALIRLIANDVQMVLQPYGMITIDTYLSAGLPEGDVPRLFIKTKYDWSDMCGIRGGNAKVIQEFLKRVREEYGTKKYPNPVEAGRVLTYQDEALVLLGFTPNRKGDKLSNVEKLKKLAVRYGFAGLEFKNYDDEIVVVHRW